MGVQCWVLESARIWSTVVQATAGTSIANELAKGCSGEANASIEFTQLGVRGLKAIPTLTIGSKVSIPMS